MRSFLPFMLLFFPALELWVLIQVGRQIGALETIALVFLSIAIGLFLLRLRGLHLLRNIQADLTAGRMPANPLIDAFCLMAAGCLFIFPGFISDAMALLLLVPGIRHLVMAFFTARIQKHGFETKTTHFGASSDDSGVTWTCTSFGSADITEIPDNAHEKRGNAVIIDCEPHYGDDDSEPKTKQ